MRKTNNQPIVSGIQVEVRNGDFNGAMRKFKKKVQEAGIIQEIRKREYYEKPSETRKKAKAAGRARWLKKVAKSQADFPTNVRKTGR